MYHLIGKTTVRLALGFVRRRYKRQLRIGAGLAVAALGAAAYLASRNVPEG